MDGFKGIFQGGECNTNLNEMGTNINNPFKNFMSTLFNNKNILDGQFLNQNSNNFNDINLIMNNFNNAWENGNIEAQKNILYNQNLFQDIWKQELNQNNINQQHLKNIHNNWWNNFQANNMNQNLFIPFNQNFIYDDNSKYLNDKKNEEEEKKKNIEESVDPLIETMCNEPDPRFRNSEFLEFLLKVKSGEYELKNNDLIIHDDKKLTEDFKKKLNIFENNENYNNENLNEDNMKEENMKEDNMESYWEELKQYNENDPNLEEKLNKIWEDSIKQYNKTLDDDDYVKHWQSSHNLLEMNNLDIDINKYNYKLENEFSNKENPLQYLEDFINNGDLINQRKVIEAHLQKNENDVNGWMYLGKLFNEINEDQNSASCFLKAININPNNSQLYYNLGINCNNVLNQILAIHYLEKYFNLEYNRDDVIIGENFLTSDELNSEILLNLMNKISDKFLNAYKINNDKKLLEPLAIINYINTNYETSKSFFEEALKEDPFNYNLVNRLGAVNAMLGNFEESVNIYQRALDLKPNYVRVWTNMGLSMLSINKNIEGLGLFLNSINLNPNSKHIWNYIENSIIHSDNEDWLSLLEEKNVNSFKKYVNIFDYDNLPKPEKMNYKDQINKYYIDSNLEEWVNKFSKND